jgi:hypothetical protein
VAPPLHRPSQQSALLVQGPLTGTHGSPPSWDGGGLHFSLPPSFGSGAQMLLQQSSGIEQYSPSGKQTQSAQTPPLHKPLQQSAGWVQASLITPQLKPDSHVPLLHLREQHSSLLVHAEPAYWQHGP